MNPVIPDYLLKGLSELLATAVLVFIGCMGCIFGLGETRDAALLNVSIAFGLAVMISVQAFGCISDAHMNPAVTLAIVILELIPIPMACVYVVAQFVGALLGFGLLKSITPFSLESSVVDAGVCTTHLNPTLTPFQGVVVEFVITGILIMVVASVLHPRNNANVDSIPIRFGMTIWVLALTAAPYTGASMNPARSLAPAIWNGYYKHLWIYFVGPLLGSAVFAIIYKVAFVKYAPPAPPFPVETIS